MKTLFTIALMFSATLTFACADLKNKPAYLTHKEIKCGTIVDRIVAPKAIVKGKVYAVALNLSDDWGGCPASEPSCYPPYLNIQRQGNALCRAYGMGKYAKTMGYSPLFHWKHETPDLMVEMKRVGNNTYAPRVFRMNHSRSEHDEIREVWCHKKYPKR